MEPSSTSLAQLENIGFGQENGFAQASVELTDKDLVPVSSAADAKDTRIEAIVSLLGEYMPSDQGTALAPFIHGFMSLRLLLLRPSRSPQEEESVQTMLESYTSYSRGGRSRAEIAVMLARDFMFLSQANSQPQQQPQQPHQQSAFFSLGQGMVINNPSPALPGYSTYEIHHQSPALGPIGVGDFISIISN